MWQLWAEGGFAVAPAWLAGSQLLLCFYSWTYRINILFLVQGCKKRAPKKGARFRKYIEPLLLDEFLYHQTVALSVEYGDEVQSIGEAADVDLFCLIGNQFGFAFKTGDHHAYGHG